GVMGHPKVLVDHAKEALKHALAGQNNPHLAEAATHLQAAIEHGNMGHTDVATSHAREAYAHIKAATRD
ncbi:MAG TPA: small metal-binding protein SmbP, partial [Methylococcaceae bacterium]|nr:small metal-binding protein SmbP [Methylococcaceae bacterium]